MAKKAKGHTSSMLKKGVSGVSYSGEALIFEHLRTEVPNVKQQEFFKSQAKHIGYGGAR